MKILKVRATFITEALGTACSDEEIYTKFIGSKVPSGETPKDELEAIVKLEEPPELKKTVFLRNRDDEPCMMDYQWKGYLKDACKALRRIKGTECSKVKAYKQIIDKLIFPQPRMIPIHIRGKMGVVERPLRAETAQGERIALAASESVPAGSYVEFEIKLYDKEHEEWVKEMLEYGIDGGTLQWRNAGYGRFEVEYL